MSTRVHNRIFIAALGLATVVAGAGLLNAANRPKAPVANVNSSSVAAAIQIWNNAIAITVPQHEHQITRITAPTPKHVPTPKPVAATTPAPVSTPCPSTVHITGTAGKNISVECHNTVTTASSTRSTNISVHSSSSQTSTGGSNNSSETTSISVIDE